MPNIPCLTAISFSITGNSSFTSQDVVFMLTFDDEADPASVKAYQWYLDGNLVIGQNLPGFTGGISCGSHTIGVRILTADGWSGIKSLSFKTCRTIVSIAITGPDTVAQGSAAVYSVIETYTDLTTEDITDEYVLSSPDGTFIGKAFTPAANVTGAVVRQASITASKNGADPIIKHLIITDSVGVAGILVVDLFDITTLDVIGLVDNPEVSNNHVAAYTGSNIIPSSSSPAAAMILASDFIPQAKLNWRFEFNIASLLIAYPTSPTFVFYIKGRGSVPITVSGAFGLKTFASQMALEGNPGSYIPRIIGSDLGQTINFTSELVAGANGSHNEADLTTIIRFSYNVSNKTITYITRQKPIEVSDFDFMSVRYHWNVGDGTDLDTMVGFENNGTSYDSIYVGYGQPNATVPANMVPQADAYLWWGSDNTSGSGYEAVLIGLKKFVNDFPSSPDVVEVGLYAVWYGPPQSGDFTVELVTYKGGTMSLSGTDFVNTGGVQVSSNTVQVNTKLMNNSPHNPSNMYKVGSVKYTKSTQSAVIEIN